MAEIGGQLSKRIVSLRFLLIVFVVFIHNTVSEVKYADSTTVYQIPEYARIIRVIVTDVFSRSAVPLFFLLSGYLFFMKEAAYWPVVKKKTKSILLPYMLWSLLAVLFYFLAQNISFTKVYFSNPLNIVADFDWLDWVDVFAGLFTARAPYPLVYQFWFIRDLFTAFLLFPILKWFIDRLPFGTFIILSVLWITYTNLYLVSAEALLFFSLGYYIVKYKLTIESLDKIKIGDFLAGFSATIFFEVFFLKSFSFIHFINLVLGVLFLLRISFYFIRNEKVFSILAWLEGYAFFVYAFHEPLLTILKKVSVRVIPMEGGYILLHYFFLTFLTVIISLAAGVLVKKITPRVYALLTGGRV
ncbi:MAG TPA: acyltransferase [Anaerolineaceae bacterium]|mgnify:CR=1 FL=1|nr:acyltransferase [Anaerolineaceae bacterium]HPN50440.1 acyltransferase [Anaerolineaceae bacterium]